MRRAHYVKYKRRKEGKTNYYKRLKILKSRKYRLVIRRMTNSFTLQFIEYAPDGDKVIVTSDIEQLRKLGWKLHGGNLCSAYLIGLLCGVKAKNKIKEAILDIGIHKSIKGSSIYAALKGVLDTGIKVPHSPEILPPDDVVKGKRLEEYSKLLANDKIKYEKQFSKYIKNNIKPESISSHFEEIKNKVLKVK